MLPADRVDLAPAVIVQRWRRYGHDRAYVKLNDQDLGYRDLRTGEIHCGRSGDVATVERATADLFERARAAREPEYEPRHSVPPARAIESTPESPASTSSPEATLLPDRDLALNAAGQAARAQARELRDAAPVRTLIARVVGAKTDERSWRIGADGEEEVARWLARLGPDWHVLHAVPIGDRGSDIDHVVIGPGGVFTINVKHHPQASVWVHGDTVKVNGFNQPYVRNSRHEARRAASLLTAAAGFDVEVQGVVAVMGAHRGFVVKQQPRDGLVAVVGRKQLVGYLHSAPAVLGAPSIARIYDVARHLATWQPRHVRRQDFPAPS